MLKKIYWTIRLFPCKRKEPFVSFYPILGFYPHNITLYEQAVLHKSSSIKMKDGKWINNERLEFLGDAILDAIVADIVFKEFEYKKEGFLTNIRSKIVQRETLNKLALNLGLDRLIKSSAKNISHKTHVYGNALEALIGAIYLDQGYRVAKKFVEDRLINAFLNIDSVAETELNYKSRLIEWGQKHKIPIEFRLTNTLIDKENVPQFFTTICIYGLEISEGEGSSKKESHQQAAKEAMLQIQNDLNLKNKLLVMSKEEDPKVDDTTTDEVLERND